MQGFGVALRGAEDMGSEVFGDTEASITIVLCTLTVFATGLIAGHMLGARKAKAAATHESQSSAISHYDQNIERRGVGSLISKVNHVALIVSDVGRSLAFYTEVIGFQQIQRPNFDRHGAWLTMGNVELHLIKGIPNAPPGTDLIVSHIALESDRPDLVLKKLLDMGIPFRQNVSVPDPKRALENKQESFDSDEGKVTQYFIRDPDGYYFELCNCDILTDFVLENEKKAVGRNMLQLSTLFKMGSMVSRRVARARKNLLTPWETRIEMALQDVEHPEAVDQHKLENLRQRQSTYCDITQGFSEQELTEALLAAGNDCPKAILLLMSKRQDTCVWLPPRYFANDGGREGYKGKVRQHIFHTPARKVRNFGSAGVFAGAEFHDH